MTQEISTLSTPNGVRHTATQSCLVTCHGCFSHTARVMVMLAEVSRCVFIYTLTSRACLVICVGVCRYVCVCTSERASVCVCQHNFFGTGSVRGEGRPGSRQQLPLEAFKSTYTGFLGLFMFLWKISLWNPQAAHFNLICEGEWCRDRAWERQGLGENISSLSLSL